MGVRGAQALGAEVVSTFRRMLIAAELRPRTVLQNVYVQSDDGWLLVDTESDSKRGWTNLTLDSPAYLELTQHRFWLAWNGRRFARSRYSWALKLQHPHVYVWLIRRLTALGSTA